MGASFVEARDSARSILDAEREERCQIREIEKAKIECEKAKIESDERGELKLARLKAASDEKQRFAEVHSKPLIRACRQHVLSE